MYSALPSSNHLRTMAKRFISLSYILIASMRNISSLAKNPHLTSHQLPLSLPTVTLNTACAINLNLNATSVDANDPFHIVINCSRTVVVVGSDSCPKRSRFIRIVNLDRRGQGMLSWKPGVGCVSSDQDSGCGIASCFLHVAKEDGRRSQLVVRPSQLWWEGFARFQTWDVSVEEAPYLNQRTRQSEAMSAAYVALLVYMLMVAVASVPKCVRVSISVSVRGSSTFVEDVDDRLGSCSPQKPFRMLLYPSGCCASDKELLDEKELDRLHETKSVQLDLFSDTAWMS